jgi:glycerol uptake facilitator-like aquaporin
MNHFIAETVGTFMLGLTYLFYPTHYLLLGAVFTALLFLLGPLSGAFFNPAITALMVARGSLAIGTGLQYLACQLFGVFSSYAVFALLML